MKSRTSQLLMVWWLPIIVFGGLFYPLIGYLVLAMMIFFFILSFFKKRYWCWALCPRGAFLGLVMPIINLKGKTPKIFRKEWFRVVIFIILISFMFYQIYIYWGNFIAVGGVFIAMCFITTIISIFLGIFIKPRTWCVICPMGLAQEKINSINKKWS